MFRYCLLLLPVAGAKLAVCPPATAGLVDFFAQAGLKGCAGDAEASARPALGQLWFVSPREELPALIAVAPTPPHAASPTATGSSIPPPPLGNPRRYPLATLDFLWFLWGQSLTLQITNTRLT